MVVGGRGWNDNTLVLLDWYTTIQLGQIWICEHNITRFGSLAFVFIVDKDTPWELNRCVLLCSESINLCCS